MYFIEVGMWVINYYLSLINYYLKYGFWFVTSVFEFSGGGRDRYVLMS